jgi:uncharacterized protein
MKEIDWHYRRKKLAEQYMREFTRHGCRALAVFSERQVGKTEFLTSDLAPEAQRQGRYPVHADLWANRADPARAVIEAMKSSALSLERGDRQPLVGVNVSVGFVKGVGAEMKHREKDRDAHEPADTVDRIGYWARRLARAAGDRKVLLMLDEAQTLVATSNALNEVSALRAAFQMNTGRYEPVFTGSSRDRLERMFADSRAPLYKYGERMEFPKLGAEFVAHVIERAEQASGLRLDRDEASATFETLGRRPGDLIGVVRVMMRKNIADLAQGLAAKLREDREQTERDLQMRDLSELDRKVLERIALDPELFSVEALSWYELTLGRAPNKPAVQRSIARLRGKLLVEQDSQIGKYRISDERLERYFQERDREFARQ